MSKITLILADDHVLVRSGLRMLLEAQPDMEIVGEAENGREALEKAIALQAAARVTLRQRKLSQNVAPKITGRVQIYLSNSITLCSICASRTPPMMISAVVIRPTQTRWRSVLSGRSGR